LVGVLGTFTGFPVIIGFYCWFFCINFLYY